MSSGVSRFPTLQVTAAGVTVALHALVLAAVLSSPVTTVALGQPGALDVQFVELAPQTAPAPPQAAPAQPQTEPPEKPEQEAETQEPPQEEPLPVQALAPVEKPKPIKKRVAKPKPRRHATAQPKLVAPAAQPAAVPPIRATGSSVALTGPRGEPQAVDLDRPRTVGQVDYLGPRPTPVYPRLSERRGEQGRVVLRVLISPQGQVEDVKVQRSSGFSRLDDAAIQAMRQARFRPYMENGIAYKAQVDIPFDFVL